MKRRPLLVTIVLALLMGLATFVYFQGRIASVTKEQVARFEEQARKIATLERITTERHAVEDALRVCNTKAECTALNARMDALEAAGERVGIQGLPGADGVDGSPGVNGKDGVNGAPGEQGPQGEEGEQGPQGDPGPDGSPAPEPTATVTVTASPSPEPCNLPPAFC